MEPESEFEKNVEHALNFVSENESIATIGIPPTRPETGYGYLELDELISGEQIKINKLNSFKEKPDLETAKSYLEKGNYLWNSGMFFWRIDHFISQMEKHLPEVGSQIIPMALNLEANIAKSNNRLDNIVSTFEAMPDISIDFGLMEKADAIVCVNATFAWDDVGDLNSVERTKTPDKNGNIVIGENSILECNNSIFINNSTKSILTSISMRDVVVVLTDDSVLVTPKSDVQKVKKIVADLKEGGLKSWL
jgi:mannose-1-phosphate guanylyltransferase